MKNIALITGITGQDGSYLAEFLLKKNYEVHGIIRRSSSINTRRVDNIFNKIHLHYGDLNDSTNLIKLIQKVQPTEIYNLGAQSHVKVSFETPEYTGEVDGLGVLRLLDAICILKLENKTKFYQASTSEMYGKIQEIPQTENTPFYPRSPYGVAKLYGHWITKNYREAYSLHASSGILFNHESPRRGTNFVTNKVVKAAVRISLGLQDKLHLGNLEATRDCGHAKAYVEAMWLMLQTDKPDDYVCATGISHSVRDLCKYTFSKLGLDFNNYVIVDEKHFRPEELENLKGDSTKMRKALSWEPKYTFESMIDEMVEYWLDYYGK